jgi:hypothetical protein
MTVPVTRLPSLSLAEVVEGWSLQDREDRKYLIPAGVIAEVLAARHSDYSVLEIDGRRDFGYWTLYYDTPDLLTYRDHAQGVRRRFKVRVRRYLDSDLRRMEVKSKGSRSRTVKYGLDGADRLDKRAAAFVRASLDRAYGPDYRPDVVAGLRPGLSMTYERTTLVSRLGERVTIDTDLSMRRGRTRIDLLAGLALVEVKSSGSRSTTDRDIVGTGYRPISFSKYVAGIELTSGRIRRHRPGLLRASFAPSSTSGTRSHIRL